MRNRPLLADANEAARLVRLRAANALVEKTAEAKKENARHKEIAEKRWLELVGAEKQALELAWESEKPKPSSVPAVIEYLIGTAEYVFLDIPCDGNAPSHVKEPWKGIFCKVLRHESPWYVFDWNFSRNEVGRKFIRRDANMKDIPSTPTMVNMLIRTCNRTR